MRSPGRDDTIDTAMLDKQTMEWLKREAAQGPMSMKLDTKGGKVRGSISVGGRVQAVEADAVGDPGSGPIRPISSGNVA